MDRILTEGSEQPLEFPRLRALVADYAHSALGKRAVEALEPSRDVAWIASEQDAVQEAVALLRAGVEYRMGSLTDSGDAIAQAGIEGVVLEGEQLREIATVAQLVAGWVELLASPPAEVEFPPATLRNRAGELLQADARSSLRSLAAAIDSALEPDGSVAESASVGLRRVRRDMERQQKTIGDSLRATLRKLSAEGAAQDEIVTLRGERFVIPVKAEQKRRLAGVVHGTSSSGATVFVEPLETIEQNNELVRLREQEQEEIRRVLRELTRRAGELREELLQGTDVLAEADAVLARARFVRDYGCVRPLIITGVSAEGVTLEVADARHPLLEQRLRRSGGEIVPVSVTFSGPERQLVISGPNTGGKTVALKTIGLFALMAQSGMPVPAERAAMPLFSAVLADIGDAQSIERDLSTFSSHVTSMERIAQTMRDLPDDCRALALFDEVGSATDPEEGAALAVAAAEFFLRPAVWSIFSTHFTAMKVYATNRPQVLNAAVGFNEDILAPSYRLRVGVPGVSAGLRMAERIGLNDEILATARERLGRQGEEIADFLARLHAELDAVAAERDRLRQREQEVARERSHLESHGRQEQREKVRELERTLQQLLKDMEAQARELVRSVDERASQQKLSKEAERRLSRARREFSDQFNQAAIAATSGADKGDPNARPHVAANVRVGDRVRLRSVGKVARVERALDGDAFEVVVGVMKMRIPRAEIAEVLGEGVAAGSPLEAARGRGVRVLVTETAPSLEVNVIGQTADEAETNVERFVDRAFLSGATRVRVVHGTGMGVLRRTLRASLQKHPHVESIAEATQGEGGAGATIVELRQ